MALEPIFICQAEKKCKGNGERRFLSNIQVNKVRQKTHWGNNESDHLIKLTLGQSGFLEVSTMR